MDDLQIQILARIDENPHRAPTTMDIIQRVHPEPRARVQWAIAELMRLGVIDTANGDSGLTYIRRKVYEATPTPSPHAPAKVAQTVSSGLAFFPSRMQKPVDICQTAFRDSRREIAERAADRAPRADKRQKSDEAREYSAAIRRKQRAEAAAERKARALKIQEARWARQERSRAMIAQHLTKAMSAGQFAAAAGLTVLTATRLLFSAHSAGHLQKSRGGMCVYYFEPQAAGVDEARARERIRRDQRPGLVPADIAAAYANGAKIAALAVLHDCGIKRIRRAIREVGGTVRPPGGVPGSVRSTDASRDKYNSTRRDKRRAMRVREAIDDAIAKKSEVAR